MKRTKRAAPARDIARARAEHFQPLLLSSDITRTQKENPETNTLHSSDDA